MCHLFLLAFGDIEETEKLRVRETYQGISPTIDARCFDMLVLRWFGKLATGQTYFFTDNVYWRYNELKRTVETSGYLRVSASVWNNIPFPVNDTFTWKNGKTFFFVDGKVYIYRYNMKIRYFEGKQGKKHFIADCRK